MIRVKEIGEISPRALAALRRKIDKYFAENDPGDVIPNVQVPASLDRYRPGNRYGAHKEVIVKREVRRQFVPPWFDPVTIPGQFGFITSDGLRVYLEVEVDVAQRNRPSTFESRILDLVEEEPTQIALL